MQSYTAVIADDEELTLQALKAFLNGEFPNIDIVASVANGMELISAIDEYRPDMAIVDVSMPRLSGIDAIELLSSRGYNTRYILNTAYSEFEYAKRALELKVDAYLLKPEKRNKRIAAINKVCLRIDEDRRIEQERGELEALTRDMQDILERDIVLSLIADQPTPRSFDTYCQIHDIRFCSGAVLALECPEEPSPSPEMVGKCLADAFNGLCTCLMNVRCNSICVLLLFSDDGRKAFASSAGGKLDALLCSLDAAGLRCRAGVSRICDSFSLMSGAYNESLMALRSSGKQRLVFYSDTIRTPDSVQQAENPYILQAMRYIRANYQQDISLEMVAEHIGISPTYLSHLFRQETGMTLVKYLTSVRMDEAILLIRSTELSVAQISERVGYLNPTYFCRLLKAATGMTLLQLRKAGLTE